MDTVYPHISLEPNVNLHQYPHLTQICPGRTSPGCRHMSAVHCVCSVPALFQPSICAESQDAVQVHTEHKSLYSPMFRTPLPGIEKPAPQRCRHQSLKQ